MKIWSLRDGIFYNAIDNKSLSSEGKKREGVT